MSLVLNGIGWLLIGVSVIYGYLMDNVENNIYLGINIAAGLIFIGSGIMGGTVDLYFAEPSGHVFGIIYILISGVETYSKRNQKEAEN